jgi:hypothetical protein
MTSTSQMSKILFVFLSVTVCLILLGCKTFLEPPETLPAFQEGLEEAVPMGGAEIRSVFLGLPNGEPSGYWAA